ncbi:hypothetical protein [Paraglaciecola chathamensis]|uniref:Phosphate-selective porin O and P n=1 Tax=Paraglaciecola chathamensis S18K6 TaxID=1127672 RepID=A0AAV3UZY7_9ALTE|nr:hypothetical protein [Paraglaciecola chathamensis]GAC10406.1 hypothetical protein GCHA_2459 [Paraglaciecola chathamensis S18K6]
MARLILYNGLIAFLFLIVVVLPSTAQQISGLVQVNMVKADDQKPWLDKGTGIVAYQDDSVNLQQGVLRITDKLSSAFSYDVTANIYQLGEQHIGITQAAIQYKPLSNSQVRFKGRAGFFYPRLSLENVDLGWLSPYTYTQSAVNSWFGEELRIAGLEGTLFSAGRNRRSPFSWEITAGAFKGNDTLGTLLSWRGFAMHDRQSLHNDKIVFADYPSVIDPNGIFHPSYVEPFHELDSRVGFYFGVHLSYYKRTQLRYYFYDNQAKPTVVNHQRLYAWRTKFHSVAFSHDVTPSTRFISQWLSGSSHMGQRFVYIDFDAWYMMISHKRGAHRLSVRYDDFKVKEDDIIPEDMNNSSGQGLTIAWRYKLNTNWQVGLEQHINRNKADIRTTLDEAAKQNQQQTLAVVQFRWR